MHIAEYVFMKIRKHIRMCLCEYVYVWLRNEMCIVSDGLKKLIMMTVDAKNEQSTIPAAVVYRGNGNCNREREM